MFAFYWKGSSWQTTSARRMQSEASKKRAKKMGMVHVQWQYYTSSWMVKNRYFHFALSSSLSTSSSLSFWSTHTYTYTQNEMNFKSWVPISYKQWRFSIWDACIFYICIHTFSDSHSLSISTLCFLHSTITPFHYMRYVFLFRFFCVCAMFMCANIVLM